MATLWLPPGQRPIIGQAVDWPAMGLPYPVGEWWMNEGDGDKVFDASGNHFDGSITGAYWSNINPYGKSLYYDGSGNVTTVTHNPILNMNDPYGITVAVWFLSEASTGYRTLIKKDLSYIIRTDTTSLAFYYWYGSNGTNVKLTNFATTGLNKFHLAVGTINPSTTTSNWCVGSLYLDGAFCGSGALGKLGNVYTNALCFGAAPNQGEGLVGHIAGVLVFPRGFDASMVQSLNGSIAVVGARPFTIPIEEQTLTATRTLSTYGSDISLSSRTTNVFSAELKSFIRAINTFGLSSLATERAVNAFSQSLTDISSQLNTYGIDINQIERLVTLYGCAISELIKTVDVFGSDTETIIRALETYGSVSSELVSEIELHGSDISELLRDIRLYGVDTKDLLASLELFAAFISEHSVDVEVFAAEISSVEKTIELFAQTLTSVVTSLNSYGATGTEIERVLAVYANNVVMALQDLEIFSSIVSSRAADIATYGIYSTAVASSLELWGVTQGEEFIQHVLEFFGESESSFSRSVSTYASTSSIIDSALNVFAANISTLNREIELYGVDTYSILRAFEISGSIETSISTVLNNYGEALSYVSRVFNIWGYDTGLKYGRFMLIPVSNKFRKQYEIDVSKFTKKPESDIIPDINTTGI